MDVRLKTWNCKITLYMNQRNSRVGILLVDKISGHVTELSKINKRSERKAFKNNWCFTVYNHISPPNFANVTGLGETSDIIIQYIQ